MILAPQPESGRWQAIAFTTLVHGVLLVFLFLGVQWKRTPPPVVEVELWSSRPAPTASAPPPPAPPPAPETRPEPKPDLKPEPKPEPKVEPKPVVKPDIAVEKEKKPPKKVEPPPKKVEPPPKPAPVKPPTPAKPAPPKPGPAPAAKPDALPKPNSKPDWERALHSEETGRAIDREIGQGKAAAAGRQAQTAWIDRIATKVRGNTIQPAALQGNPVAVFTVNLLPSGEVLSVKLKRSSGVRAWDEATERAILKSSPLPKPAEESVFRRDLELILCPDERGCR